MFGVIDPVFFSLHATAILQRKMKGTFQIMFVIRYDLQHFAST